MQQDPAHVLLFVDVIKEGSIAAAARKHQITRATASRRIKALEQALGVQLLHRTTQHTRLTQAGEIYYEHACGIDDALRQAEAAVRHISEQPSGLLRIAIPVLNTEEFLMPAIWGFIDKYPEVQVKVVVETDIRDMVAKGIDIAFQIGFAHNTSLKMRRLLPVHFALFASADYIEKHGLPTSLEDLHEHRALMMLAPDGSIIPWHIEQKEVFCPKNIALSTNSADLLMKSILSSRGIGSFANILIQKEVESGQVIQLFPEQLYWMDYFSVVHADTNIVHPKVRAFVDYIVCYVDTYISQKQVGV